MIDIESVKGVHSLKTTLTSAETQDYNNIQTSTTSNGFDSSLLSLRAASPL
jgi:hypothetical protein